MKCGISTASFFGRCYLEETPQQITRCGAGLVEVFLNTFSEYELSFIELMQQRLQKLGLQVYSVHPHSMQFEPQLTSTYVRQREDAFKLYEKILQGAKKLGAKCYVFHGMPNMGGLLRYVNYDRLGGIARDLADMARDYDMYFTWENVSWCLFQEPEFALRIKDASKSEHLKFTLDIKQAARSGHSPQAYLDCMGKDVMNVHICDYRMEGDMMRPLMPGQGQADLAALKAGLAAVGYDGPAFLEVYSNLYSTLDELAEGYRHICRALED